MSVFTWKPPSVVNTTLAGYQDDPDLVTLPNGGYVIVWKDNDNIIGRYYNADGTPRTGEIVMADHVDPLISPDVTVHADGTVFLTYNINQTGTDSNVIAAYDTNGTFLSSQTTTSLASESDDPDIIVSGDNVYIGLGRNIAGTDDAYVLRYEWNGSTLTYSDVDSANNTLAGEQEDVDLAVLTNGNIVAVWRDGTSIEFEIKDPAGTNIIGVDVIVANTGNSFNNPEALALANGGFVITYARSNGSFPGQLYDIYFKVYAPNGAAYGSEVLVNGSGTSQDQFYPAATALNDGGFAVFWFDAVGGDSIRGQLYDGLGNPRGGPFIAAHNVLTNYDTFDVDTLPDGRIALTYMAVGQETSTDIFTKILDPRDGLITGKDGDDTLHASNFADEIYGLDGDDLIMAMEGDDLIFGGFGADHIFGEDGNDVIYGGIGIDTLIGGLGDDTFLIMGGELIDEIAGGSGDDTLDASGYTTNFLTVDLGADTYTVGGGAGTQSITSVENVIGMDTGGDMITGNDDANKLEGLGGNDTLDGGTGDDMISGGGEDSILGERGDDLLEGGADDDIVRGGNGKDTIEGGGGADVLDGNSGLDHVLGGGGADLIRGRAGSDVLEGGDGQDTLEGGSGSDTISGQVGHDLLDGGGGSDELFGNAGNDTLIGGLRDDTLSGGSGADVFVFETGFGHDVITDFGSNDAEDIDLSAVASINNFNDLINNHLVDMGGFAMIDAGGGDTILLGGVAFSDVGVGLAYSADDFIF